MLDLSDGFGGGGGWRMVESGVMLGSVLGSQGVRAWGVVFVVVGIPFWIVRVVGIEMGIDGLGSSM
jgi:hypothetical protein